MLVAQHASLFPYRARVYLPDFLLLRAGDTNKDNSVETLNIEIRIIEVLRKR